MTTTYDDMHAVTIFASGAPDRPAYTLRWRTIGADGQLGSTHEEGEYVFLAEDLAEEAHVELLSALRHGPLRARAAFDAALPRVLVNAALVRAGRERVSDAPRSATSPYSHARSSSARAEIAASFVDELARRLREGKPLDDALVSEAWSVALEVA